MSEMEDKLGTILGNPQLMQQIMSMANSLSGSGEKPATEAKENQPNSMPMPDPGLLRQLTGLAGQSGIDHNQRTLLSALTPYLSHDRIGRLEKAMRAAKMARFASSFLNNGGLSLLTGR